MRYAHQTDPNQTAVVKALRQGGCVVAVVSMYAGLGYDLIVTRGERLRLMEIKDGTKPPSDRRLTDAEHRAQRLFPKWWREILSPTQALEEMGIS